MADNLSEAARAAVDDIMAVFADHAAMLQAAVRERAEARAEVDRRVMLSRTKPSLDKVRRCAALAMHESVTGNDHLAYAYAAWIKRYCEELLYEDMYRARPEDDQPADGEGG